MMRTSFAVLAALAAGLATTGALYWAFLNTPESNALMLVISAALAVATVVSAGVSVNLAVLVADGAPARQALWGAVRGTVWFIAIAAVALLAWRAIRHGDSWVSQHQGEINAWFIAQFGWADIAPLLQAEAWLSWWLRWTVVPLASMSMLSALLTRDRARGIGWLLRAWRWRSLLIVTIAFLLLNAVAPPLIEWRPAVPSTWAEPAVAALRLAAVVLILLVGATILILISAHHAVPRPVSSDPGNRAGGQREPGGIGAHGSSSV
jgi:hypothetical protein